MTVIVAANLIEGPYLASDSRVTQSKTKKTSDTATKIIPLTNDLIVGVAGDPIQAGFILDKIVEIVKKDGINSLDADNLKKNIEIAADRSKVYDLNNQSKCHLIFAGIDKNKKQIVHTDKFRYFLEREHQLMIGGNSGLNLMMALMNPNFNENIMLDFPKSFIYELEYPSLKIDEIDILELKTWGSGSKYIYEKLVNDFHKLWDLKMIENAPFFKRMIFTLVLTDAIKDAPKEIFIGGLPQMVSIDAKTGINFQSFTRNDIDSKPLFTMKFNGTVWEQIDEKTGKIVKTMPSLFSKYDFDKAEIVDFAI